MLKPEKQKQNGVTILTKKNEINSEPSGAAETGSASLNTNETITERMPSVSESSSMSPAVVETQVAVYTESFSDLKKGDLSFDQLIESIGARIIRLDERAKSLAAGDDDQTLRSGARADGGDVRSPDCRVNENETGTTKVLKEAGEIK